MDLGFSGDKHQSPSLSPCGQHWLLQSERAGVKGQYVLPAVSQAFKLGYREGDNGPSIA